MGQVAIEPSSMTHEGNRDDCCDPPTRVTRSLLGYGVIAGPFYVAVWLIQAATRSGFSISRDAGSLLSNGHLGWIQVTNFLVTGAMVIAAAVGFRRALAGEGRTQLIGWLVGLLGVGMLAAGLLKPDPSYGFPAGAPSGKPITTTAHGNLHLVFGSIGFLGLIIATFVFAGWLRRRDERRLGRLSAFSGAFFLAADLSGAFLATRHEVAYNLSLTTGMLVGFAWLTWSSIYLYRMVSQRSVHPHMMEVAS
jgi:hypothetical protein